MEEEACQKKKIKKVRKMFKIVLTNENRCSIISTVVATTRKKILKKSKKVVDNER